MAIRNGFHITLPNHPGTIVGLVQKLGNAGVQVDAAAVMSHEDHSEFEGLFSQHDTAARVLQENGYDYREVRINVVWLPAREGNLDDALTPLAGAGINIESFYLVGTEEREQRFAITCSDPDKAEQVLSGVGLA